MGSETAAVERPGWLVTICLPHLTKPAPSVQPAAMSWPWTASAIRHVAPRSSSADPPPFSRTPRRLSSFLRLSCPLPPFAVFLVYTLVSTQGKANININTTAFPSFYNKRFLPIFAAFLCGTALVAPLSISGGWTRKNRPLFLFFFCYNCAVNKHAICGPVFIFVRHVERVSGPLIVLFDRKKPSAINLVSQISLLVCLSKSRRSLYTCVAFLWPSVCSFLSISRAGETPTQIIHIKLDVMIIYWSRGLAHIQIAIFAA